MQESLHCISALADAPQQNRHTIFLDSDDDPEDFDAAKHFNTSAPSLPATLHLEAFIL